MIQVFFIPHIMVSTLLRDHSGLFRNTPLSSGELVKCLAFHTHAYPHLTGLN